MTTEQPAGADWAELEALADELRSQDEQWRTTCEAMAAQLELVRGVRESTEQQIADLGVEEQLVRLAQRLLNDAARLHSARLNYGLTRSFALIWHPLDDPRPALREAPPEAQYAVEVRVGPHYLLGVPGAGAGDERISIVIAGEKRLVATLPTTREKLRAALLRAFAAPSYSGPAREAAAAEAASTGPGTAEDGPAAADVAEDASGAASASETPDVAADAADLAAAETATADASEAPEAAAGQEQPPLDTCRGRGEPAE